MKTPVWRKSSRSGTGNTGGENCVEVARLPEAIGVRDSKNPAGGTLSLSTESFATLLTRVKRNDLTTS